MLNISKIETMVSSVGSVSLDAIRTWYPKVPISDLKDAINKSEKIKLSGSKVTNKTISNNTTVEVNKSKNFKPNILDKNSKINSNKDILIASNKINENFPETKNIYSNLKYEDLYNIIQSYNEQVLSKHKELIENDESYKYNAILSFLKEKYDLTAIDNDNFNKLYLLHKKNTNAEIGYAILVPDFDEKVLALIQSHFPSDTVFVYYINSNSVDVDNIISTIFPKATTKIIEKYKMFFEIDTLSLEILQIKSTVGKN
ncbi:hypothetical protein SAMN02745163_04126 [Clostridium cavendishii DSM 21758]|uniref:Uncharacterized protein n=1 Tax=Clostridium cavendishii DSM 21758 TaxID=1121302 RepID=A0A1M6TVC3_9CLOT|nr:hypothetical protein [Clostridium cavendishii]SHK60962.1 hypothetical protein SAMN02745163_04126 [Clostridium cavendishii DSM 21758]